MTIKNEFPALYKGLNQIPIGGLVRLQKKLKDGVPMAVWGGYAGTDFNNFSTTY